MSAIAPTRSAVPPHIRVDELRKTFHVAERQPGLWGAVRGLFRRRMRAVTALDGISFDIAPGELVGFIGPNGAGKSTTVKCLSGILVPDGGRVSVLGRVPWRERVATVARLGVVFGQRTQLWWDLPVSESFELLRDIYRVPPDVWRAMRNELIDRLDIGGLLDTPVRQLSLGQRMRADLAAALLHRPEVLFLDEPTIGLDAVSKLAVRDFIRELNRDHGVTVILTTHDMDDIEALARRVLVIDHGRLWLDGTVDEMRQRITTERRLIVDLADAPADLPAAMRETVEGRAELIRQNGHRVWLRFDPASTPAAELIGRVAARHAVLDLMVENPPIEEIVARLYGGQA